MYLNIINKDYLTTERKAFIRSCVYKLKRLLNIVSTETPRVEKKSTLQVCKKAWKGGRGGGDEVKNRGAKGNKVSSFLLQWGL